MSDSSWSTDEEDHVGQRRTILIAPLVASFVICRPMRVEAELRKDEPDNRISISTLRRLRKPHSCPTDTDLIQELQWYPVGCMQPSTSQFIVGTDTDFGIMLGARACKDIERFDKCKRGRTLLPSFTFVSERDKAIIDANKDARKRHLEQTQQENIERLKRKHGIEPPPSPPPPPPPTNTNQQANNP